jgi:hypothetical protein
MTLDELTMIARRAYEDSNGETRQDDFKAAILTVLDAVERECVPQNFVADPKLDYEVGYNYCRAEMLRRLTEMRK